MRLRRDRAPHLAPLDRRLHSRRLVRVSACAHVAAGVSWTAQDDLSTVASESSQPMLWVLARPGPRRQVGLPCAYAQTREKEHGLHVVSFCREDQRSWRRVVVSEAVALGLTDRLLTQARGKQRGGNGCIPFCAPFARLAAPPVPAAQVGTQCVLFCLEVATSGAPALHLCTLPLYIVL